MGAPELLVIVMLAVMGYGTIAGVIRAARNKDNGWVVSIIAGWLVGLGWIVGYVYIAIVGRRARITA